MTPELFNTLLVFLGAVVAALLFVMDRTNRRVADALPKDTLDLMYGLLALAESLAKLTPTPADDELVDNLRGALGKPDEPPTAPQTAEELAARLDGNGAVG